MTYDDDELDRYYAQEPEPRVAARPAAVRTWLIVATALSVSAAVCVVFPALMSVMIFNAPPNPPTLVAFVCLATFPLVGVGAPVLAWLAFAVRLPRLAVACSLLPLANVAVGAGAIACVFLFLDGKLH